MSDGVSSVPGLLTGAMRQSAGQFGRLASRWRPACGPLLAVADVAAVEAAVAATSLAAQLSGADGVLVLWDPALAVAAAMAAVSSNACLGLYDGAGSSPVERFRLRVWSALLLPWLALAVVALCEAVSRQTVATLAIAAMLWVPLASVAETRARGFLVARSAWGTNALLLGSSAAVDRLAAFLLAHPEDGLRPVGFCGCAQGGERTHPVACLGPLSDAERFAHLAEIAVVALSPDMPPIDLARLPFRRVVLVPEIEGIPAFWLRPRDLGSTTGFEFANPAQAALNSRAKRALDLLVALQLLIVSLPLIGLLALTIKAISPGPAFYTQRRVGWRGSVITIFKLRTMQLDAEGRLLDLLARDATARQEWETYMKLSRDPRVIPFLGRFLRCTSLDELPQLWNVVRGDISLVGPRPFPAYHIEKFNPAFQALRASVRPGLTGLWQISERSDAKLHQQEALDRFYIKNWSLWLDLYIVLRTFPAILKARGAR